MHTKTHAHEIYLLENYISLEYFGELRDTWAAMVEHLENCLDVYMRNLHPNYRSQPLSAQPDIVWGNRVLPNFRSTLQGLNQGFILLTHGDFEGLAFAHGPRSDFKGQMDYWSGWMPGPDENLYGEYLSKCVEIAHNIVLTEGAYWDYLPVSNYTNCFAPIRMPAQWPKYIVSRNVFVESGKKAQQSGIYIPNIPRSCAQFLSTNYSEAPPAKVLVGCQDLLHPTTGEKYDEQPVFEEQSCIWYLVTRSDEPVVDTLRDDELSSGRVLAGNKCPKTGYYFTPALLNSRRIFREGEVMPDAETSYGLTIWQWDSSQA